MERPPPAVHKAADAKALGSGGLTGDCRGVVVAVAVIVVVVVGAGRAVRTLLVVVVVVVVVTGLKERVATRLR